MAKKTERWKEFEQLVAQIYRQATPEATVKHNFFITGKSGRRRQIDVSIESTQGLHTYFFQWNNLLWPLVISNTDGTRPIAVGLRKFLGEHGTDWNLLMAAATLATLPVVALYLLAQRWFVRGITMSGMGGR